MQMRDALHSTTYCKEDKHLKETTLLATCFALLLAFSSPVLSDGHLCRAHFGGKESRIPTLSPLDGSCGSFCFWYCHVLLSIVFQVYFHRWRFRFEIFPWVETPFLRKMQKNPLDFKKKSRGRGGKEKRGDKCSFGFRVIYMRGNHTDYYGS